LRVGTPARQCSAAPWTENDVLKVVVIGIFFLILKMMDTQDEAKDNTRTHECTQLFGHTENN
jgi:hypothetical protein